MRELAWRKGHAGSALDGQDVEVRQRGERAKKDKNRDGKRILRDSGLPRKIHTWVRVSSNGTVGLHVEVPAETHKLIAEQKLCALVACR